MLMTQKSSETWNGIPRDRIEWNPTIDYGKCNGCLSCFRKCTHGVYSLSEGKPKVTSPKNCVVGCTGCESVCPQKAISHPPKKYLQELSKHKDFRIGCECGGRCI